MLSDETLKAVIEGIIYVAPEPVTLDAIVKTLEGEERERVKAKLEELVADYEQNQHGIQIRQVANGYKFSTKVEHHETLRKYVKSLKPSIRLSKPALETLAVIAYRQPVTLPEIDEIRGVDSGGVIHTLLEKKLVVTAGRKTVVGRPILYRTSRDFLVHFGLKDVSELPSLKEFEELAKRAVGSDQPLSEVPSPESGVAEAPDTGPQPPDLGSMPTERQAEEIQPVPAQEATSDAEAPPPQATADAEPPKPEVAGSADSEPQTPDSNATTPPEDHS